MNTIHRPSVAHPFEHHLITVAAIVERTVYPADRGCGCAGFGDNIAVNPSFIEHPGPDPREY